MPERGGISRMSDLELLELFFILAIILMLLAILILAAKRRALMETDSKLIIDAA